MANRARRWSGSVNGAPRIELLIADRSERRKRWCPPAPQLGNRRDTCMPIDPDIEREIEALRRKSSALANEFDGIVSMLATRQSELDCVRRDAEGYRARSKAVLVDAEAEVREIIRFMRDFERAAAIEAAARDSWRKLDALASEQDALAARLSASCDELRIARERLSAALNISSAELAVAFAKARAAPIQPATGTPNERLTAEYLARSTSKPHFPPISCTPGTAADRDLRKTIFPDGPSRVPSVCTPPKPKGGELSGERRLPVPHSAGARGVSVARLVMVIACFLALLFLIAAMVSSTSGCGGQHSDHRDARANRQNTRSAEV